jgi:two-component system phosphate regulon response regulator PhoB
LRSIVFRFDGSPAFARALREGDHELPLPMGTGEREAVADGEWVLAMFEVGVHDRRRATAASARIGTGRTGNPVLVFDLRDWERLLDFAEAGSLPMMPAAKPASTAARGSSPSVAAVARGSSPSLSAIRAMRVPGTAASAGTYARVLVVDDEPETCEIVGAMLEAVGLAVDSVHSAEEALDRLRAPGARPPASACDLVVLDWNLPGMSGIELCRVLRKDPTHAMLPIIVLSGRTSSQEVVDAFAAGADDYVAKPFRVPELGARIFALLRRARMVPASPG